MPATPAHGRRRPGAGGSRGRFRARQGPRHVRTRAVRRRPVGPGSSGTAEGDRWTVRATGGGRGRTALRRRPGGRRPAAPVSPGAFPSDPPPRDERRARPRDLRSSVGALPRSRRVERRSTPGSLTTASSRPSPARLREPVRRRPLRSAAGGVRRNSRRICEARFATCRDGPKRRSRTCAGRRRGPERSMRLRTGRRRRRRAPTRSPCRRSPLATSIPGSRREPGAGGAPGLDELLLASVSRIALDLREALAGSGRRPSRPSIGASTRSAPRSTRSPVRSCARRWSRRRGVR